ncbi:(-)-endo-fenchol synthase, chloroplastic [Frankliniella fusca]|uniref:(-)-endo-fenchol synthase, chloroplastic n=1 Tax=Frankliniella fusca TaxID=407009 RepID=A0AAE1LGN5_9NEOP|nr:(-)-endo-fenchol synthase, chloroplastic [Frankliniella fusca]
MVRWAKFRLTAYIRHNVTIQVRQRWPPCRLPEWLRAHDTWTSLNKHLQLLVGLHNVTLHHLRVHHRHQLHRHQLHHLHPDEDNDLHFRPRPSRPHAQHGPHQETMTCHSVTERSDRVVQMVVHVTQECESGYSCLRLYQRDQHVMELQRSGQTSSPEEACRPDNFDPLSERFTTFITPEPQHRQCPYSGRYAITNYLGSDIVCSTHPNRPSPIEDNAIDGLLQRRGPRAGAGAGAQSFAVGCGAEHTMEFHSHCEADTVTAYTCHGSWSDNGTRFAIALPVALPAALGWPGDMPSLHGPSRAAGAAALHAHDDDVGVRRLCFVYRELASDDIAGVLETPSAPPGAPSSRQPTVVIQSRVGEECHRHHLHADPRDLPRQQSSTQEGGVSGGGEPPLEAETVFLAFDLTPKEFF